MQKIENSHQKTARLASGFAFLLICGFSHRFIGKKYSLVSKYFTDFAEIGK